MSRQENDAIKQGHLLRDKGDFDGAIADFTEAIRLDPKYSGAYYNRGHSYSRKGDKAKAKVDFAQAKKLGYKAKPYGLFWFLGFW